MKNKLPKDYMRCAKCKKIAATIYGGIYQFDDTPNEEFAGICYKCRSKWLKQEFIAEAIVELKRAGLRIVAYEGDI